MKVSAFSKCYTKYTFISGLLKNCLALKLGEGISKPMMSDFLGEGKALPLRSCSPGLFRHQKVARCKDLCSLCFNIPRVCMDVEDVKYWKKKKNVLFSLNYGRFCTYFLFFFLGICIFLVSGFIS